LCRYNYNGHRLNKGPSRRPKNKPVRVLWVAQRTDVVPVAHPVQQNDIPQQRVRHKKRRPSTIELSEMQARRVCSYETW